MNLTSLFPQTLLIKLGAGLLALALVVSVTWLEAKSHYLGKYESLVSAVNQAVADQKASDDIINKNNSQAIQGELNETKALLSSATSDRDRLLSSSTKGSSGTLSCSSGASNGKPANKGTASPGAGEAAGAVQPTPLLFTLPEPTEAAVIDVALDNIAYMNSILDFTEKVK